jgi:hypothetical protein
MISAGDEEHVSIHTDTARPRSSGPRGSLGSPRAVPFSGSPTRWGEPAPRAEADGQHVPESGVQQAVGEDVREALPVNLPACHPVRLLFATHLLEAGHAIRTSQELLGREDVTTNAMLPTHILNRGGHAVRGPPGCPVIRFMQSV